LYPVWLVVCAFLCWRAWRQAGPRAPDGQPLARAPLAVCLDSALVFGLGLLVVNAGYGFQGTGRQLGSFVFRSSALTGLTETNRPERLRRQDEDPLARNRFRGTWLEKVPVPLPEEYVAGLDEQKSHADYQLMAYLGGHWQRGGWWYYYLYALAV